VHYILLPLYRSCVYIKMCMLFYVYLYGDVINQVKHFKTDTSKIIETIIEWVMMSISVISENFFIIWLSIWAYFMKVIPETFRALWIRYIRILLKHTAILYVVMFGYVFLGTHFCWYALINCWQSALYFTTTIQILCIHKNVYAFLVNISYFWKLLYYLAFNLSVLYEGYSRNVSRALN
jgi:hypothetical protein